MAEWFAALPNNYDEGKGLERTLVMMNQLFDVVLDGMRSAREIFTPEQINEFPPFLRASFDINRLKAARPTAGFDPNW
jgi:hypothetical protein